MSWLLGSSDDQKMSVLGRCKCECLRAVEVAEAMHSNRIAWQDLYLHNNAVNLSDQTSQVFALDADCARTSYAKQRLLQAAVYASSTNHSLCCLCSDPFQRVITYTYKQWSRPNSQSRRYCHLPVSFAVQPRVSQHISSCDSSCQ